MGVDQMGVQPTAQVRLLSVTLTGSLPGAASSLPALQPVRPLGTQAVSDQAPPDMVERIARGRLTSPLPYGVRSDYDRGDHPVEVPAIELANGLVRALVLPSFGGRVWSLTDEVSGRELVYRNPRLRWANFGLTDAWFAGGIEWNLGSTGHGTTSNLPMHTAVLDTPLGPVVRLWEWERTRDLILQVDLWLSGPRLMASTCVVNPDPEPKPLYYWTNIAAVETDRTRVLVPARTAWRTDYGGMLERVSVPFPDGPVDISVPRSSQFPADYFYEVASDEGRLVTAVEPDGRGIAQTSTDALRGRKLFLWGDGPGGRRWQDWLGIPGSRYLEIQAGVCATQLEHDLLDGSATRSWTEAFLPLTLDPAVVDADYVTASRAARDAVHAAAPPAWLEAQHARWLTEVADLEPGELAHRASGWGRAELALREARDPAGTPFPEVEDESLPLVRFLAADDPSLLDDMSTERPTPPLVSNRWMTRLDGAVDRATGWWVPFALGTARHLRGDTEGARAAYERSIALQPNGMALRGLAVLTDDEIERADLYRAARALIPEDRGLALESLAALLDAGRPDEVVAAVAALPEAVRDHGRTHMLLAKALAAAGDDVAAVDVLRDLEVPDLAEGDRTLSDVWTRLRPGQPVPAHLDFRMSPEPGPGTD